MDKTTPQNDRKNPSKNSKYPQKTANPDFFPVVFSQNGIGAIVTVLIETNGVTLHMECQFVNHIYGTS